MDFSNPKVVALCNKLILPKIYTKDRPSFPELDELFKSESAFVNRQHCGLVKQYLGDAAILSGAIAH
jgi:hypothetical protein